MVREGLSEEVTLEVRPEWKEGASHPEIISGRGNNKCKGSEARVCLGCWRAMRGGRRGERSESWPQVGAGQPI